MVAMVINWRYNFYALVCFKDLHKNRAYYCEPSRHGSSLKYNPGIVRPDEKREFPLPVSPDKLKGACKRESNDK